MRPSFTINETDCRSLIENSAGYRAVSAGLENGALSHAYVLSGEDKVLVRLTAAAFAARIARACDITRLPADSSAKVLTEDINFLTEDCVLRPFDSAFKAYVVRDADTMTEQAQNKLLKTLEEPPATAVIILCVAEESKLLPTVRSRCRFVRCPNVGADELFSALAAAGADSGEARFAAEAAGGSLFRAEKILNDGAYRRADAAILDALLNMKTSADVLEHAARLAEFKDIAGDVLDYAARYLREAAAYSVNGDLMFTKRGINDIITLAGEFPPALCAAVGERITLARKGLRYNCGWQGAVDGLLFGILEEKAKLK